MPRPKLLVIDDEEVVREAVAESLKSEAYDLFFAENGEEGLRITHRESPTVIILDLRMPVMNGLEFLASVGLGPHVPYSVIVLTGHGDLDAVKGCYDEGISAFLRKPFDTLEIRGAVKHAVVVQQLINHLEELVNLQNIAHQKVIKELAGLKSLFHRFQVDSDAIINEYKWSTDQGKSTG